MSKHVQCKLQKDSTIMTAWIPVKAAKLGATIDLDDPQHGETKGWTVMEVGTYSVPSEWARDRSRDYLNQRKMSDL